MSLNVKCPMCGELDKVENDAMYKHARCNACSCKFFVKDAIQHSPVTTPDSTPKGDATKACGSKSRDWAEFQVKVIVGCISLIIAVAGGWVISTIGTNNRETYEANAPERERERRNQMYLEEKAKLDADDARWRDAYERAAIRERIRETR